MLQKLKDSGKEYDVFSILRPTSPFRSSNEIKNAWKLFYKNKECDSLRAIEKCKNHPGKMWTIKKNKMIPLIPKTINGIPWHSSQYSSLPEVFSQNASLEIAWTNTALNKNSIAESKFVPFTALTLMDLISIVRRLVACRIIYKSFSNEATNSIKKTMQYEKIIKD